MKLLIFSIAIVLALLTPAVVWGQKYVPPEQAYSGCGPNEVYQFTDKNGLVYCADKSTINNDEGIDWSCVEPYCYPMDENASYPPQDNNAGTVQGQSQGQGTGTDMGYKAIVELNYESDCWTETTVDINDGEFGKMLANESFTIDPSNDEANDLWKTVTLGFDNAKNDNIQALVNIYGENGAFIESVYGVEEFSENTKTYNFEFNGLAPC